MTERSTENKPNLRELMEKGGSFKGFPWPKDFRDFDIRIKKDGSWHYQDSPIERLKLCQLFATVLQRDEEGTYWLVTPGERGRITVDDAPFLVVEMTVEGSGTDQILRFRTNLDHWVSADQAHPIRVTHDLDTGEPSPYIMIRDGLEARLNRSVFYQLAEMVEEKEMEGRTILGVWSQGQFFELGQAEE